MMAKRPTKVLILKDFLQKILLILPCFSNQYPKNMFAHSPPPINFNYFLIPINAGTKTLSLLTQLHPLIRLIKCINIW